jgi:hypothetical protein
MADVITGNTQLGATKQELIASLVQRELAFRAQLLPTVRDVSTFAVPGAKSISFPKLSSFTVTNRTEGSAGDASALTATVDTMLLEKNAYIAYIIDSVTNTQANIDSQLEYAQYAAAAHARYVDEQIISGLEGGVGTYINDFADTANVAYVDILEMRKELMKAKADMSRLTILASPEQDEVLFNLDEFKRSDVYGSGNIPGGEIPRILGARYIVHPGLTANQLFMYEDSALAVGFQRAPSVSEQGANEYGSDAVRVAIDQLFGVKAMQTGKEGADAGKSPLIIGLNDPVDPS